MAKQIGSDAESVGDSWVSGKLYGFGQRSIKQLSPVNCRSKQSTVRYILATTRCINNTKWPGWTCLWDGKGIGN